jgi:hypothetical protein
MPTRSALDTLAGQRGQNRAATCKNPHARERDFAHPRIRRIHMDSRAGCLYKGRAFTGGFFSPTGSKSHMTAKDNMRTAAEVLVDQLVVNGVRHAFCVPGESYLAVLDAFHDRDLAVTVCRQEGGAAIMAEAVGKATGQPGVCFVTRGPGATNASAGIHIAHQDSTPMIMFVGQVARRMRGREAFQELDYRAVFGSMTKWTTEIDDPARVPEIV